MSKATEHLRSDFIISGLIDKFGELTLKGSESPFEDLVNSIIGQQLSGKAATVISKRVEALLSGNLSAASILTVPDCELRKVGVSNKKASYIKNLANAVERNVINLKSIKKLDDEDIIKQLTAIKGIGRWTAEMFLLFSLAREDVYSLGDGGLSRSINKLYSKGKPLGRGEITEITSKWRPYRSYASLYLWRALDADNQ